MLNQINNGGKFGSEYDLDKKLLPDIIGYQQLSELEKENDRVTLLIKQ